MNAHSTIERLMRPVLLVVIAVMAVSVGFQIIARYLFAAPPVWTGESSTLALVYLTFLGAALVVERGEGFRITFLRDRYVQTPFGRTFWQAIQWFEVALTVVIIGLSVPLVTDLWTQSAVGLGISISWFALGIPLGLAGMVVALVRAARRRRTPESTSHRELAG